MIFGLEISFKATTGYNSGLLDKAFMAKKQADEKKLREAVAANPKLQAEFGDPWGDLEKAIAIQKEMGVRATLTESTFNSSLLLSARTLVRAADEKAKP